MRLNAAGRSLLIGGVLFATASCDLLKKFPVIRDFPAGFASNAADMRLAATITQDGQPIADSLVVKCEVSLQQTPQRFAAAVTILAERVDGNVWNCAFPAGLRSAVRGNQNIRFRWQVFGREGNAAEATLKLAETEFRDSLLDCSGGGTRATMIADNNAVVARFGGLDNPASIAAAGYLPTHNFASLKGIGVAFAKASDLPAAVSLADAVPPVLGSPSLLFYLPPPGTNVNDIVPDGGLTLIGWAYSRAIPGSRADPLAPDGRPLADDNRPHQRRPLLTCIPHHEWMIHSAGMHRLDGRFETGTNDVFGAHHAAIWDLHVWREPAGSPATLSIANPRDTPGLPSPESAFFYPTAYDP